MKKEWTIPTIEILSICLTMGGIGTNWSEQEAYENNSGPGGWLEQDYEACLANILSYSGTCPLTPMTPKS